ncbi:transposase DNA-binding-containing protein, partial [Candidatus Competibacter phosphatis]
METVEVGWAAAERGGSGIWVMPGWNRRLVRVAERLGAQPNASIPVACNA